MIRLLAFLTLLPGLALAQEDTPATSQPALAGPLEEEMPGELIIATREAPPFAFRGPDGAWTGISIDLLRVMADELDFTYALEEAELAEMIAGVGDGRYDASIAALSITPEREEVVDFTHPFYSTGLGIAVDTGSSGGWFRVLRNIFTWQFGAVLAGLSAVLLLAGAAIWAFERRGNNEEFRREPVRGLGDGFWWAAVTMTTVGYGDKSPRTLGGRIVGLIWMFTAMIIVASFTAAIAAALTVGQLGGRVADASDLASSRVGVVEGSSGAEEMQVRRISTRPYPSTGDGLAALANGELDAFVHDRPLLQFLMEEDFQGRVRVLPEPIGRQDYGIALPEGSELREPMNRALLAYVRSEDWGDVVARYIGSDPR
ncbi:ligand-gated ion channel [Palleronia aestuarii]|uniref:Ligand-gated ion channel n=1 Tax=Palleronia aestuarii TaxID=568105 RepID=A0A2W7P037_9RHOB|nr:transporter substrate-binding domain-containing protein [Palleronia aestuarii]PZX18826.1 ligand-gated ion channel [Palleronia aestuarii]